MATIMTEQYELTTKITTTKAYSQSYQQNSLKVFLRPRPYALHGGYFVLVPLLPLPVPLRQLPAEIWSRIIGMIIHEEQMARIMARRKVLVSKFGRGGAGWRKGEGDMEKDRDRHQRSSGWNLALVCKYFKTIALPLLYAHCEISTLHSLEKFTAHLISSEKKWDSLRRIPYSTPGRWVQSLNLCDLEVQSRTESTTLDALLTSLFPILPFLARLELPVTVQMSARAMRSLGERDGIENLRSLTGVKYDNVAAARSAASGTPMWCKTSRLDALTLLLSHCTGLEELEIIGTGLDDLDTIATVTTTNAQTATSDDENSRYSLSDAYSTSQIPAPFLRLPRLRLLSLLATPSSALFYELTISALPALRHVVVTPYGELGPPTCLLLPFLAAHGSRIRSLVLHTPKSWPTFLYPPPQALLTLLPKLTALSVESTGELIFDLPFLSPPTAPSTPASLSHSSNHLLHEHKAQSHPLVSLWLPRPTPHLRDTFLMQLVPHLPYLREIRARLVRWPRCGISAHAQETGSLGEMYLWRRLLISRGVKMLDADGREASTCV